MRQTLRIVLALLVAAPAWAQTITPRGAAATLDVASWNLEFFGTASPFGGDTSPNDEFQFRHVDAVVAQSGIDVWGFQEVSDGADFRRLVDSLAVDGYAGVLGPTVDDSRTSPNDPFDQKLAFIYDARVVTLLDTMTLFKGESGARFDFAGRYPLEMRARVSLGGATREVRFIVIHAKASSDPDSYNRRVDAATRLKTYTDGRIAAGESVVILGDFNDRLTGATRGVSFASPYAAFVADPAYTKATLETEQAGLPTFCGSNDACSSGNTIDHVLLSAATLTFVPASGNAQRQRYGELLTDLPQYTSTTSDHLPVLANVSISGPVALGDDPQAGPVALLAAAPNPFRDGTQLRFRLDAPSEVRLDVFDALGRRVASVAGAFGAGEHPVALDGAGLAPGLYVVRLAAAGAVRTQRILRVE